MGSAIGNRREAPRPLLYAGRPPVRWSTSPALGGALSLPTVPSPNADAREAGLTHPPGPVGQRQPTGAAKAAPARVQRKDTDGAQRRARRGAPQQQTREATADASTPPPPLPPPLSPWVCFRAPARHSRSSPRRRPPRSTHDPRATLHDANGSDPNPGSVSWTVGCRAGVRGGGNGGGGGGGGGGGFGGGHARGTTPRRARLHPWCAAERAARRDGQNPPRRTRGGGTPALATRRPPPSTTGRRDADDRFPAGTPFDARGRRHKREVSHPWDGRGRASGARERGGWRGDRGRVGPPPRDRRCGAPSTGLGRSRAGAVRLCATGGWLGVPPKPPRRSRWGVRAGGATAARDDSGDVFSIPGPGTAVIRPVCMRRGSMGHAVGASSCGGVGYPRWRRVGKTDRQTGCGLSA